MADGTDASSKQLEIIIASSCNQKEHLGVTGGWMRVAGLDMTNSSHQCPSGLRQRTDSGKRTCGIDSTSVAICSSVVFPINDLRYSQVCGKIIAYQFASPDAFSNRGNAITAKVDLDQSL